MPIRHVAGNVVWTVHGTVWALYRVQGVDQVHSSKTAKLRRLKALEALVKKLVGESMWLSLCPQVDPRAVVRAMTEDIDMQASGEYTQVAHRVLDRLEGLELTGRTDWLAVPLPAVGRRQRLADMAGAAKAEVALRLGLLPAPISRKEEGRRRSQAAQMAATWPGTVAIRPASEAEILWIYGHSARRGVLEPLLPTPDALRGLVNRGRTVAALGQAVLTEGAIDGTLADEEERRGAGVFKRRWLEVATEYGASYQSFMTLSEMPEAFRFPGSEYLAALDTFDFPVDWVVRLNVTPGAVAEAKTRRKARDLAGQPEEWAHDPAGVPASIGKAADSLAENRERLTASKGEVDVRAMVAFCVWGGEPAGGGAAGRTAHCGVRRRRLHAGPAARRSGAPLLRDAARRPHPAGDGVVRAVPARPGLLHGRSLGGDRTRGRAGPVVRVAVDRWWRPAGVDGLHPGPEEADLRVGGVPRRARRWQVVRDEVRRLLDTRRGPQEGGAG
ncbi:hypothetical protein [Streptomyces sp. NPDC048527]|uniref:hypothetical protein n=1 Tax=Streptomyces sp. NPDC048527 TaxID=3365568 RepID=UPI003714B69E